ncbi:MAG: amidohydrolase family protein, partial [Rhodospirillales bacterium]|nr:amidohydrolase family protein [Rhodospirillales bacterium]
MIIDVHGHTTAPQALYGYNYGLIANRGDFGQGDPGISDADIEKALTRHLALMDEYGIDLQLIPPRPWGIPNAETSEKIVGWMAAAANNVIARQVTMYPTRFQGMAGLPQTTGVSPANCTEELERCVMELGFVGCMINPDPGEGDQQTPGMGEEFWYPLYEKMVELDVPGLIHTGGCRTGRESQSEHFITEESIAALSILRSSLFRDFPSLKLIIAHGGGSLPYQVGRYRGSRAYL